MLRDECVRRDAKPIAEGSSRESKKDYLHFLYIARGSLSETQYFVHLSKRLGFIRDDAGNELLGKIKATFACLHGLITAVEKEAGVVPRGSASSQIRSRCSGSP